MLSFIKVNNFAKRRVTANIYSILCTITRVTEKQYSSAMKIKDEEFMRRVLRKENMFLPEKELTEEEKRSVYMTP